jgi:hypothetical protein
MSRVGITQPIKAFTGTAGSVNVPRGSVLVYLTATGNGSIIGIPDGQGNSLTLTIPNTSQWFIYDSPSLALKFSSNSSPNQADPWVVVFSGTTAYYMEIMNPSGGF